MLIPRFSVRHIFWVVNAAAAFSVVLVFAALGHKAAQAIAGVVWLTVLLFVVFALIVAIANLVLTLRGSQSQADVSPFAQDSLPPRYVAPENEK